MTADKTTIKSSRTLRGVVISDKMQKTAVVAVTRLKLHPKLKKYYKVTKKFKSHDANNEYKVGQKVVIQETKPISKDKKWVIISKI